MGGGISQSIVGMKCIRKPTVCRKKKRKERREERRKGEKTLQRDRKEKKGKSGHVPSRIPHHLLCYNLPPLPLLQQEPYSVEQKHTDFMVMELERL